MSIITELLEMLLNDNEGNDNFDPDFLYNGEGDPDPGEGGPDPGEGGPDPDEGGPDPGEPGSGEPGSGPDGTDPDDKSLGKVKGKARAITPEFIESPYTDLDKNSEEDDFEKARLESWKNYNQQFKQGESSKQGELLKQIELSKQGESSEQGESSHHAEQGEHLSPQKEEQTKNTREAYQDLKQLRLEAVRSFNDIMEKINREGDSMDPQDKAFWLNETIEIRNIIDNYTSQAQNLKDQLNIDSEEENSEQGSGDSWSGYSSDEESISSKGSDSSDKESRPSKRPRK